MVSNLSCLEDGCEKSLQKLLMGSKIHSFLCYSSNCFVKYSCYFWFGFVFPFNSSWRLSIHPSLPKYNKCLSPRGALGRERSPAAYTPICTGSSRCSDSSSARLWQQLLPASMQMAASSWCLNTSGAYAKINHFLTLITFYPSKILWRIVLNPASTTSAGAAWPSAGLVEQCHGFSRAGGAP